MKAANKTIIMEELSASLHLLECSLEVCGLVSEHTRYACTSCPQLPFEPPYSLISTFLVCSFLVCTYPFLP